MNEITTILTLYKRSEYLKEQIEAVRNQTEKSDIWLWVNNYEDYHTDSAYLKNFGVDKVIVSSENEKYYGRFTAGLLVTTRFISILDDDTIPGPEWYSTCTDILEKEPGNILGGAGVILTSSQYMYHTRHGWPSPSSNTKQVDLVGHAWFFERPTLNYMFYEEPFDLNNGEDIQFAYLAQKHGGVKCYAPPHPTTHPEKWSSLKAWEYGDDKKASSNGSLMTIGEFYEGRDRCVKHALSGGWNTVNNIRI